MSKRIDVSSDVNKQKRGLTYLSALFLVDVIMMSYSLSALLTLPSTG